MTSDIETKDESRLSSFMRKRLNEGVFILLFAFSLFMLLSLVSYERSDPSLFGETIQNTTPHVVLNAGGYVGAYIADFALLLLGFLAYAVPLIIVYLSWMRLYPGRYELMGDEGFLSEEMKPYANNSVRVLGAVLLLLGAAGLASFEFFVPTNVLPHTAGGIVGDCFSKGLDEALNPKGTILLLLAMSFMGITLLTGLSWVVTAEQVGFYTLLWVKRVLVAVSQAISHLFQHAMKKCSSRMNNENKVEPLEENISLKSKIMPVRRTPRIDERAISELVDTQNANLKDPVISREPAISRLQMPEKPKVSQESKEPSIVFSHSTLLNKVTGGTIPPLSLLEPAEKVSGKGYTSEQLELMARNVEQRLLDFGIEVQVVAVHPGPVITRFELQLAAGVKVSRITGLAKDLARSLSVISVRVVDVIPGKPVIGLELPNKHREIVRLCEIFLTDQFQHARSPVSMALGVDISGYPVVVDLAKMPHLLVAGTTGSGKSVGLNAMLLSILFKATPDDVRLILVDPKMLEFSIYDRIPHLLTPVVTDMKEAAGALRWSVAEMERRYRLMSALGVRNLAAYNLKVKEAEQKGEPIADPLWTPTLDSAARPSFLATLPYIVVVIDELADMMMVVGKKVEQLIARIAQKARAAGIHLILATQRPSVDVLTGLIKSNIPTRIAFQVSSKIDSRTILDQQGADQLLGHGDMLYLTPGSGAPMRIHGAFVDDAEVHRVADAWRALGDPQYVDIIPKNSGGEGFSEGGDGDEDGEATETADLLYDEAVRFVTETRKASISSVQRRFKVGYNRAARLIEEMERTGVVSMMESHGSRDVLAPPPPPQED